jgi:DNA-directed RNA polymerase specialized sigma24 family protein
MLRSTALRMLPATHARILTLADEGYDANELAERLSIDPSAVGPLLRVARSKFAALEALDEPGPGEVDDVR